MILSTKCLVSLGEVDPRSSLGERTRPMFAGQWMKKENAKKRRMQYGTNGRRGECHGISCQDIEAKQKPGTTRN